MPRQIPLWARASSAAARLGLSSVCPQLRPLPADRARLQRPEQQIPAGHLPGGGRAPVPVRIDQYQGADAVGLEEKIKQHLENDPGTGEDTDIPKGYMDLMPFINKAGCECLNESDEHGFENCFRKDASYLESDCDEQLLLTVAFSQPVKLYSMKLQGPDNGQGPKAIKIFINLPRSMDFEEAERSEATQALELGPDDIRPEGLIPLRYVKFQNVNSVTLFVQSNHGEEETTRISYFTFIGTPVQATNMNDFKRVVGKKGESH
ncbi:thioredoxin-like protein 1 isoform 3-T3 [Amazona ochrocephala]